MHLAEPSVRFREMFLARGRHKDVFDTPVRDGRLAGHMPRRREPRNDIRNVCPIYAEIAGKGRLVDPRIGSDDAERAELYGRDIQIAHLVDKDGNADLVKAPDEKPRAFPQRRRFIRRGPNRQSQLPDIPTG
jgi:hypothetical protein